LAAADLAAARSRRNWYLSPRNNYLQENIHLQENVLRGNLYTCPHMPDSCRCK
jgi:hypothetical protein